MNRAAHLCVALSWPLRLIILLAWAWCFDAVAQETSKTAVAPERSLMAGYSDNGYGLCKVIPIENLSPRIHFTKGMVSLIPDPTDRTRTPRFGPTKPYMVVYLINDTDEPIPRIIGELHDIHSQVHFGGNWYSRELPEMRCGTVAEPNDLPARHALALGGISDQLGDIGGEIRYVFYTPKGRVASEPQRGRYFASDLQVMMRYGGFPTRIDTFLEDALAKNQWKESMPERNLEELCAILELTRHCQLALGQRAALMDWLLDKTKKNDATKEQKKAMVRIKGTLSKPWLIDNDTQALADRCIAALEAKPSNVYGTPEKCRACVWRYLASIRLGGAMPLAGDESKSADKISVLKLVELAKASLESGDAEVADAAAGFLGSHPVTEEMVSTSELLRLLESDRPARIGAALYGLNARDKIREAKPWLEDRMNKNDPKVGYYYRNFRFSLRGEMEDWERAILIHLFKVYPLETLETFSVYGWIPGRVENFPKECTEDLRGFLNKQLSAERKKWWADEAERDKRGLREPSHRVNCQALSEGIRLLDALNDPADLPLLESFLEHPAANASIDPDGNGTIYFPARERAKECLRRRNVKSLDRVVTQIEVHSRPRPRSLGEDFMRYMGRHELPIMGVSLAVLTGAGFALRRLRSRRRDVAYVACRS